MILEKTGRGFRYLAANLGSLSYLFSHASPQKALRVLALSRKPIIVGGCGRSGTTLLLSVLSCHPAILGIAPETVALCPDGYGPDGLYNKNPDLNAPFEIQKIYRYLMGVEIDAHAKRWCEKTPRNVLYFDRILRHFGKQARIIHIVRDGRDVITSRHPVDPNRFWTTPDRWVQDVNAGLKFEDHPQVLTIRYEDLLLQYEKTVRSICSFIDEEFVEEFLNYPESSTVKLHLAWPEGPRAISTKSIAKWTRPEFSDLIGAFLQKPEVEYLLRYLGYSEANSS